MRIYEGVEIEITVAPGPQGGFMSHVKLIWPDQRVMKFTPELEFGTPSEAELEALDFALQCIDNEADKIR